jgi:hypothetical protein
MQWAYITAANAGIGFRVINQTQADSGWLKRRKTFFNLKKLDLNYKIKGVPCSTHGGDEKCVKNFGWKARREETTQKTWE